MMSTVNETAMTTMGGNATINGTTLISTTFEERALQQQGKPDKMDNFEELDDLNVSDFDGNLFLDGCKVGIAVIVSFFCENRNIWTH